MRALLQSENNVFSFEEVREKNQQLEELKNKRLIAMRAGLRREAEGIAGEIVRLETELGCDELPRLEREITETWINYESAKKSKSEIQARRENEQIKLTDLQKKQVEIEDEIKRLKLLVYELDNQAMGWGSNMERAKQRAIDLEDQYDTKSAQFLDKKVKF